MTDKKQLREFLSKIEYHPDRIRELFHIHVADQMREAIKHHVFEPPRED